MLSLAFALAYAVSPGAKDTSDLKMTVASSSAEGSWSCFLDLSITTSVAREKRGDRVTVTVHAPHARMEAVASSPASFRDTIASESPAQQQAIARLDGKSLSFLVDRTTGMLLGAAPRFAEDVSFAGVDAAYWFALVWRNTSPAGTSIKLQRTHATDWGVPWVLSGAMTISPESYLARAGELAGDLVAGGVKRHLKIALATR